MKKYASLILVFAFLVSGCTTTKTPTNIDKTTDVNTVTVAPTQSAPTIAAPKVCEIPNSIKMSDFLGFQMKDLAEKYNAEYKVMDSGYALNIMCENDNYKVNIMSTKKDLIANYVIINLKEFGTCDAGIENVKGWVDKSITAVGYNPASKGTARYNTESDLSQIIYDNFDTGDKKIELLVECNITGSYIAVNGIM
ncbi:hypothetical protein KBD45_04065 [Candidatus Dojkabacteria bacterium]|nr:hypothetical protein [Candidatus Dojkabacteria bacterium]